MSYQDHDIEVLPVNKMDDPAFRKPFFGASHTAALFNDHPFQTAADYWLDKRDGTSQPETQPMVRGRHLEAAIATWFAEQEGKKLTESCPYARGHIIAVPDREIDAEGALVEIKTTLKYGDEVQDYWVWQCQTNMLVTGAKLTYLVHMDGNQELHVTRIEADESVFALIWERTADFMASLSTGEMPSWIERTAATITRQYPDPADQIEAGEGGMDVVADYYHLLSESKKYADAAQILRDQLFEIAGEHEAITDDGVVIATFKARAGQRRFDSKTFAADHPEMYEQYRKQGKPTRALEIPKQIKTTLDQQS